MKTTYNYRLNCEGIIDGTIVSFKADSREEADAEMKKTVAKCRQHPMGYSFVRCGKMTSAQVTGSQGGAKSKRTITKRQQAAMQKARRASKKNVATQRPRACEAGSSVNVSSGSPAVVCSAHIAAGPWKIKTAPPSIATMPLAAANSNATLRSFPCSEIKKTRPNQTNHAKPAMIAVQQIGQSVAGN